VTIGSFSTRHPSESYPLGLDFAALLSTGETVTSGTVTASVVEGTDASVATRFTGAVAIDGAIVKRRFTGGVAGVLYLVTAVAQTDAGNTFESCAYLQIEDC
jgi:hypothetical protein